MKKIILTVLIATHAVYSFSQAITNPVAFRLNSLDTLTGNEYLPQFPSPNLDEAGFVKTNGSSFEVNGEKIRFWGSNIVADAAFPSKNTAKIAAARAHKFGFNLMRIHHVDNNWSGTTLFDYSKGTRTLHAAHLDQLEYFISELKNHSIYIDMNLNVSRGFTKLDGVPEADSLKDFAKALTIFDPHLIELQKEYAKNLLTHTNPYTGKALVDDPVMAMVEIINENSLLRNWREDKLRLLADGGNLPRRHFDMLDSLWIDFLTTKYATTAKIDSAWKPVGNEVETVLFSSDFESSISPWKLETNATGNGSATLTTDANGGLKAANLNITNLGSAEWHVQFYKQNNTVEKGGLYELKFWAKADANKKVKINFSLGQDPWTWYGGTEFSLTTDWKEYTVTFKAPEKTNNLRIGVTGFSALGNYFLDDVSFKTIVKKGLGDTESLESKNIPQITFSERLSYTAHRIQDQIAFYIYLQKKFMDDMKSYLVNDLGVKVPITANNWLVGPEDLMSATNMDYTDNHSYWNHPNFPNEPWSSTDWYIDNTSLVKNTSGGSISPIFEGYQFPDKPYTISEYNHCSPNQFQAEMLPMISYYAGFHGVDAIMFFDYNTKSSWNDQVVNNFTSIHENPVIMTQSPLFAWEYRFGKIKEATDVLEMQYTKENALNLSNNAENAWKTSFPFNRTLPLEHKIVSTSFDADSTSQEASLPVPTLPYQSSTGEITWNPVKGFFQGVSQNLISFVGEIGTQKPSEQFISVTSASKFAALNWFSLDNEKAVLTLSKSVQNTNMKWANNTTVKNNWGSTPTVIDPIQVTFDITNSKNKFIKITPLDQNGNAIEDKAMFFPNVNGTYSVSIDQIKSPYLWFGISYTSENLGLSDFKSFELEFFPNPTHEKLQVVSLAKVKSYEILSTKGQTVVQGGLNNNEVDVRKLPEGLYLIKFVTEAGEIKTARFVKE